METKKTFAEVAAEEREIVECGVPHPYYDNPCILLEGHYPATLHCDGDDNEWQGKQLY